MLIYQHKKQDLKVGDNHVSRCQRTFQALPVNRAASRWLHLIGKVWLPTSCFQVTLGLGRTAVKPL